MPFTAALGSEAYSSIFLNPIAIRVGARSVTGLFMADQMLGKVAFETGRGLGWTMASTAQYFQNSYIFISDYYLSNAYQINEAGRTLYSILGAGGLPGPNSTYWIYNEIGLHVAYYLLRKKK